MTTATIERSDYIDPTHRDDRVLVTVFLRGGADGLTLVPPVAADAYRVARPFLAVGRDSAIDLDGYFALNNNLQPLMKYADAGDMAIIHGAGSENGTRSHFEAQDTMDHAGDLGSGWLARYLRARGPSAAAISAVCLGATQSESLRGAPAGTIVMQSLREFSLGEQDEAVVEQLARLYANEVGPFGQAALDTIDAIRKIRDIRSRNDDPDGGAVYPDSTFGRGMREIARLIKADLGLVATTIDLNGWDTHFVQLNLIGGLMTQLAQGVDALLTDLGRESQRITVVVMTEFGRRLAENTSFGTDHGAGSTMFLLGDNIGQSGIVRSGWTDLSPGNLDDVGDVPAAINYRDVLAPILLQHAPSIDLARVFPIRTPTIG